MRHALFLTSCLTIRCAPKFTNNAVGEELGQAQPEGRSIELDQPPIEVEPIYFSDARMLQISAGATNTCAIDHSKQLHCWGSTDTGINQAPPGNYTQVAVGDFFACALKPNGNIKCWGQKLYNGTNPPNGLYIKTQRIEAPCL